MRNWFLSSQSKVQNPFFRLEEPDLAQLKQGWAELIRSVSARPERLQALWEQLVKNYSEPHRSYHNLSHIKALLDHIQPVRDHLEDIEVVSWAIWFHDVIYRTRRSDNEEQSAAFAFEWLNELEMPPLRRDQVHRLILATKHHSLDHLPPDGAYFLDADLAILGAPEPVYAEYRQAIRREYSWVPEFVYRRKRRAVLESFLTREQLYFTSAMRARLEAQARQNLSAEIQFLSS
ncbi:MAG: hypothetical protein HY774_17270 [Acidobacteria bacterium]|nr:hypothetical protein [Acidobacteriota bacterium]